MRDVAPESVEAAASFGATRLQVLLKVKIPLARDAIMLGINQGIIMVLAVVVIGGLVGSGGLGYEVAQGLQRNAIRARRRRIVRDPRPRASPSTGSLGNRVRRQGTLTWNGYQCSNHEGGSYVEGSQGSPRSSVVGWRALAAVAVLVVAAAPARTAKSGECGTVTLNEQAWAGSTANTYVAKAVLEEHGLQGEHHPDRRDPRLPGDGRRQVDAVLEDWQHVAQYKQYIDKQQTVVARAARTASRAHRVVHPDVPDEAHPEFATWKGLKGKETLFKSPESARRACSSAATRPTSRRISS